MECKMITSLDDIRKYTEHSEYNLVYNGYDLSHLFYLSKQAGYEPQVRFSARCVFELNFKFKIKINSKSHKEIPCETPSLLGQGHQLRSQPWRANRDSKIRE